MGESKLISIIIKRLFEDYAFSLDYCEGQQDRCIILRYRNCYDTTDFRKDCSNVGMDISDTALSIKISEIIKLTSFPVYGFQQLEEAYTPEQVFTGEIIRIKFSYNDGMDLMKLSAGRWWISYAYGSVKHYLGTYPDVSGKIGNDTTVYLNGTALKTSSAVFVIPTPLFRMIDSALHHSCYLKEDLEDNALESVVDLLKKEMICIDGTLDFRKWRGIADISYSKGFDYKTFWYITNAVSNQLKGIEKWS